MACLSDDAQNAISSKIKSGKIRDLGSAITSLKKRPKKTVVRTHGVPRCPGCGAKLAGDRSYCLACSDVSSGVVESLSSRDDEDLLPDDYEERLARVRNSRKNEERDTAIEFHVAKLMQLVSSRDCFSFDEKRMLASLSKEIVRFGLIK